VILLSSILLSFTPPLRPLRLRSRGLRFFFMLRVCVWSVVCCLRVCVSPFPFSTLSGCAQIPALNIRADAITFANCTMESEKFITVREQAGEQVMIHMVRLWGFPLCVVCVCVCKSDPACVNALFDAPGKMAPA